MPTVELAKDSRRSSSGPWIPSEPELLRRLESKYQFISRKQKVQERIQLERKFVAELDEEDWKAPRTQSSEAAGGHSAVLKDMLSSELLPWLQDRLSSRYQHSCGVKPVKAKSLMPKLQEDLLGRTGKDDERQRQGEQERLRALAQSAQQPSQYPGLSRALRLAKGSHVGRWNPAPIASGQSTRTPVVQTQQKVVRDKDEDDEMWELDDSAPAEMEKDADREDKAHSVSKESRRRDLLAL
mmetsp:Transcript_54359/g.126855  ORF Transcript_54359/g.126855 Transcript_54359/m.126855 type:complete len:240 (-) Transcript_54359:57-776(-)